MEHYDEIEFYNSTNLVYKTCLQEFSNGELRRLIYNHGKSIKKFTFATRVVILTNGKIRLDSNKNLILLNDIRIVRFKAYLKNEYKSFFGFVFGSVRSGFICKDVESGVEHKMFDVLNIDIDVDFYKKRKLDAPDMFGDMKN